MIVVRVELHSANTGEVSEIGRMIIANDGTGDRDQGNYIVKLGRKGTTLNGAIWAKPHREGEVKDYARNAYSVWELVARALKSVRFGK